MRLHYVWVGHLPAAVHRDYLWSICIKYGFLKDLFMLKFGSAIVCYEDKEDSVSAEEGIALELFEIYRKWCPVTKIEWGCCFTVEVSPIPSHKSIHHLLYSIFRPYGPIVSIQVHKPNRKAFISFSQMSDGLKALTLQTELLGESLHVIPHRSVELFRHKVPRAKLNQELLDVELVQMLERLVQVEKYDDVLKVFHLFGSKVEVNWALERIKSQDERSISSSSSLVKYPSELVELKICKIPYVAGKEEVEHLFRQFGLVEQIIKDESCKDQRFYKCYMQLLVSTSLLEFSLGALPTMRGSLVLRGSTLNVSQIMVPQPTSISKTTTTNKTDEPVNHQLNGKKFKIENETKILSPKIETSFVKLFVSGDNSTNQEKIEAVLKNFAVLANLWIPSSGYSFVGVNLLPDILLSTVLSLSNELMTFRLAVDQSMEIPAYYNHPISPLGWVCAKSRCNTRNTGLSCAKCGLECTGGNCRAAMQQAHGVVTKIFNKSRGIVAFMEPVTGREDYAYFFRGNLDLASSSQEFRNLVGKFVIFNATATGCWEELAKDIWVCWVVTSAALAPYNNPEAQADQRGTISQETPCSENYPIGTTATEMFPSRKDTEITKTQKKGSIIPESIPNMVCNFQHNEAIPPHDVDSDPQNLLLWPTHVESVTTFWAKDLDEVELLTRLEEVHDACLMREALDDVPEQGGIYGGLIASSGRFHRVQVTGVHHIHCIEVFYLDEGFSSILSLNLLRPLPLHLTSLAKAGRKYELAGCFPVSQDESLVYGNFYQGKEWLRKLLLGEEVRATGLLADGRNLVDCIAAHLHVNTEVLDRGYTTQVLQLPPKFKEII